MMDDCDMTREEENVPCKRNNQKRSKRKMERSNKKILTTALSLAFALSATAGTLSALNTANAFAATTGTNAETNVAGDTLDYVKAKYGLSDHVYDVVTIDRLKQAVETAGKSVIVFADVNSDVAKAAIPAINTKAKELGISKIYYFDPILAGEYGVNFWDSPETYWPNVKISEEDGGSQVTQAFVNAKNILANDVLGGLITDSYVAANDTLLFVTETNDEGLSISKQTLIQSASDLKADSIADTLGSVIAGGRSIATALTDYDYFNSWNKRGYDGDYEDYKDDFKVRSITYYELRLLLESEGTHTILASGSWCGDSQTALPWVVEYSSTYDADTVYVFDFRLTNGVGSSRETSVVEVEGPRDGIDTTGRNFITRVGYLGEAVIEAFGEDYPTGIDNSILQYIENGALTVEDGNAKVTYKQTADEKFRSPFLVKYNKEDGVQEAWLNEVEEWEIPYVGSSYSVGDLIDNELASGALSNTQKAQSRYELAVFFGGDDAAVSYTPTKVPHISESNSELDSGCGDDNDPINNLGQASLIPNHGSSLYNVSHYDIDVELKEGVKAEDATFESTTVITAKAVKALSGQVSFDFRKLAIGSVSVKNITQNTELTNVTYEQINNDEEDLQKLIVRFDGAIAANEEFEVTVSYTALTVDKSVDSAELANSPQGFNVHIDEKGYTAIGEPFGATYWFPNNNTPADGATYKITLRAPIGYTLVSNGVRTAKQAADENGNSVAVWEVNQETATYQIFATFSKNLTELSQASGTRGEGLYTTADGRQIPIIAFVNTDIYQKNRTKVENYFAKLPLYIKTLESQFGAYPGEALGFVFENIGNGHGEPAGWGAVETKDRPFYTVDGVIGENTFVHEIVHQWYGNAVRLENWDNLWLNEGFATFGTDLYYEATYEDFSTYEKWKAVWESKGENSALWKSAPAAVTKESDLFGGAKVAYNRGAMALALLRHEVGAEKFAEILEAWIDENFETSKTTAAFVELAEEKSGLDLTAYSQVWLYGTVKPAAFTLDGKATLDPDNGNDQPATSDDGQNGTSSDNGNGQSGDHSDGGSKGCGGTIIGVSGGVLLLVAVSVTFLVVRKKKEI